MQKHWARPAIWQILSKVLVLVALLVGCNTLPPEPTAQPRGGGGCVDIQCPPPLLTLVQTNPSAHKVGVALNANISAEFNLAMNSANPNSFSVKSPFFGRRFGQYSVSAKTLTFNPDKSFLPGEEVEFTLTKDLTATDGKKLSRPYTYRFMAKASPSSGSFAIPLDVDYLSAPSFGVALGLLDGDDHLDIASVSGTAVRVVVGDGSGTFDLPNPLDPPILITIADSPRYIQTADMNGDGWPDLATGNNAGSVSVILNTSNNFKTQFADPTTLELGTGMSGIALADYDGDGKLDVAVNQGTKVKVIYGDGNGGFKKDWIPIGVYGSYVLRVSSIEVPESRSIASGDVNGDGRIDLVLAGPNQVSVIRNNLNPFIDPASPKSPQPDFKGPTNYAAALGGFVFAGNGVALADLTGDGRPEIIRTGLFDISVYKNKGSGSFEAEVGHGTTGTHIQSVTAADVNGDNKLDILTASEIYGTKVLIGNGMGGFSSKTWVVEPNPDPSQSLQHDARQIQAGDVDGDGDLDLVVGHGPNGGSRVVVLKNKN